MNPQYKQHIIESGGTPIDRTHLPLHAEGMDAIRETFRAFGQGLKVAVKVILIAADKGQVPLYHDVIGVGGRGRGADTAIVARATTTKEAFSKNVTKKLEIREILAMPVRKKWW